MEKTYAIGLDYGTLSARAALVCCQDGEVLATAVKPYPHQVMDETLPDGKTKLGANWALEHPGDYILAMEETVGAVMKGKEALKDSVVGIGIDFTSCTILPVDREGTPLCLKKEYGGRPHAYVKLWKHHAAQPQADRINAVLQERGELEEIRYGGRISSELLLPKVLQILEEDPEIYEKADQILEAGDWLTQTLTGGKRRSGNMAGYKAMWLPESGYPDKSFLRQLDPRLEDLGETKLKGEMALMGEPAGFLTEEWANRLGLPAGIPVAPAIIDSHAGLPGSGVSRQNQMMMVVGTSSVMLALTKKPFARDGVVSGIRGGIVPGYYALESGLAAVGDMLGWFVDQAAPESCAKAAREQGMNLHTYLTGKAEQLKPGQSGLAALDWWNGNKTPFVDGRLSGVLAGCTLGTKPEEIYRALIEATAFGTRRIVDLYEEAGAQIEEIIASGGIAEKNPLFLQIYADVLGKRIRVSATEQTAAVGSAVYASVAAGAAGGGYETLQEAVERMSRIHEKAYEPDPENQKTYQELYELYKELSGLFDPGKNTVLAKLLEIKSR